MIAFVYFNRTDGLLDDVIISIYKNQFCLMKEIDASIEFYHICMTSLHNLTNYSIIRQSLRVLQKTGSEYTEKT